MPGIVKLKGKRSPKPKTEVVHQSSDEERRRRLDEKRRKKVEAYQERIERERARILRAGPSEKKEEEKRERRSPNVHLRGSTRPGSEPPRRKSVRRGQDRRRKPTVFYGDSIIRGAEIEKFISDITQYTKPTSPGSSPGSLLSKHEVLVSTGEGLGNIIMSTPLITLLILKGFIVDVIVFPYPKDMEFKSIFKGYTSKLRHVINGWNEYEHERLKPISHSHTFVTRWGNKRERVLPWFKNVIIRPNPGTREFWAMNETDFNLKLYDDYVQEVDGVSDLNSWQYKMFKPYPISFVSTEPESKFNIAPFSVGFHFGCKTETIDWRVWKQWPYFHILAKFFENVVLFGTSKDYDNYKEWVPDAEWPKNVKSLLNETPTVGDLGAAISKCSIFISNDSGVAHVAAAAGVPTFILIGGTSKTKPQHSSIRAISTGLNCQPCYLRRQCPEYPSKCLVEIHPNDVAELVKNDLEVKHFFNKIAAKKTREARVRRSNKKPKATILIPIRDRPPSALRNTVLSLQNQTCEDPLEIRIIDGGSSLPYRSRYRVLARNMGIEYHFISLDYWNKPLVLNYGIRHGDEASKYIISIDSDIIVGKHVLKKVIDTLDKYPKDEYDTADNFLMVRTRKMKDGHQVARDVDDDLLGDFDDVLDPDVFEEIKKECYLTGMGACGGLQASTREFLHKIRGYDEDLFLWGAPDSDMFYRALNMRNVRVTCISDVKDAVVDRWKRRWGGTKLDVIVDEEATMIHQYHSRRNLNLQFLKTTWDFNCRHYKEKIKAHKWVRNKSRSWGVPQGRKIILRARKTQHAHLEWEE